MNRDDETLLSAFLDGELGPSERLGVEEALLAEPRLATRLRELALTRDLVASLSRPVPASDFARQVTARLGERRKVWPLRLPLTVGGGLSAAALVLIAVTIGLHSRPQDHKAPPIRTVERSATPPSAPRPVAVEAAKPASLIAAAPVMAPAPRPSLASAPTDKAREHDEQRFRALLDSRDLRTVLFITDVVGGGADRTVGELVEKGPRLDSRFGRLTVGQGIVIDPRHPNEAVIYTLVLSDDELAQLRGDLRRKFDGELEESEPEPAVVTQLAEVGQLSVLPGTAVAAVERAPDRATSLAFKSEPGDKNAAEDVTDTPARPVPPPPAQRPQSIVLVWVTTRDPRSVGP